MYKKDTREIDSQMSELKNMVTVGIFGCFFMGVFVGILVSLLW